MASKLADILHKNHYELSSLQGKSRAWFQAQARKMQDIRAIRAESLIRGDADKKTNRILPGTMVMFAYDPKFKETLPYYDTFPLCLPFRVVPGGFYGINLHYLPYEIRAQLLDRLMEFKNTKGITDNTKLKLSWQLLDGASKFAAIQPCVKHYLYEHVETPFKIVSPTDWATAIMLPVERFEKQTAQQVWARSLKQIR